MTFKWNLKFEINHNLVKLYVHCEINETIDIQNRNQIRHLKHQLQIQKNFLKKKILKKIFEIIFEIFFWKKNFSKKFLKLFLKFFFENKYFSKKKNF